MPFAVEDWIKRRCSAAVDNGLGRWVDSPETVFGRPLYEVTDGPVTLTLSELGFKYDGPPASFACRYDNVVDYDTALLREILPKEGDFLPRSELSRLLTFRIYERGASQPWDMQFSLRVYNQVHTVLDHILYKLGGSSS